MQNDALQWVIEESIERGNAIDLEPEIICRRILALNMVAIHTTSIVSKLWLRLVIFMLNSCRQSQTPFWTFSTPQMHQRS